MPDFHFEDQCAQPVAGIDEAGRGPWAGPVVAAAVVLSRGRVPEGLDDSKKLSAARRSALYDLLVQGHHVGIGRAEVDEIDTLNIVQANFLAMERAVAALPAPPAHLLIDGNRLPKGLTIPAWTIVKGDARAASIAAASIVAKVTRDRIMQALAVDHPGYGWETNMGYGTPAHQSGLARLGVTAHHRRSFRPIHNILYEEN